MESLALFKLIPQPKGGVVLDTIVKLAADEPQRKLNILITWSYKLYCWHWKHSVETLKKHKFKFNVTTLQQFAT